MSRFEKKKSQTVQILKTSCLFKIVFKKVQFSSYSMQRNFHSDRELSLCYYGHRLSNIMGMPMGTFAPSCPPGFAHPGLTA